MRGRGIAVSQQVELLESRALLSVSSVAWVEQGPGPITNGSVAIPDQDNPVTGAVQTIAVHPTNSDILVVGTVQGGIWKTTNANSLNPVWTPTTDFAPTLGILDLAYSPLDATVLYAGTGSFTNASDDNSPAAGVFKSTNGGNSWQTLGQIDTQPFRIRAIVPTKQLSGGNQVLFAAAVQPSNRVAVDTTIGGLYRSTDGGMTWELLTRAEGTPPAPVNSRGLPQGAVSDAKADPTDSTGKTVYIVMPAQGVYRTTDGGDTWTQINNGISSSVISNSRNARIAVNLTPGGLNLGVGFVDSNGQASGVFVFNNNAASPAWSSIGVPIDENLVTDKNGNVSGNINPGKQGNRNFSLAADPVTQGVFYAGGDAGGTLALAHIAKFDGTVWTTVVGSLDSDGNVIGGASGTSPHADSRDLEFDASGHLLESDDGGIFRLTNPNNPGPFFWQSANGNLRSVEVAAVAYDSLNNLLVIGTQDNGGAVKGTGEGFEWRGFGGGDGNTMQVVAGPALSTHYLMQNNFQFFKRRTVDASNRLVDESAPNWNSTPIGTSAQAVKLALPATPETPLSGLVQADQDFSNAGSYAQIPFVINRFDTDKMVIGYNGMYLATNQGDLVVEQLAPVGFTGRVTSVAYGGRLNGADDPNVVYFGASDGNLYARFGSSGTLTTTTFGMQPGRGGILDIALDPDDATQVYIVDTNSRVWRGTAVNTPSESWTNITGTLVNNLPTSDRDLRTIEIYNPTSALDDEALLVGGFSGTTTASGNLGGGVFYAGDPFTSTVSWTEVGTNLPNVLVTDVRYDAVDDLLIAGTNGRGVWTVPYFSKSIGPADTFAVALGANGNDIPVAITLTEDGGYAVVGNTLSFNGDNQDIWLSRFDSRGNLMWTRTYAGSFFVQLTGTNNPDDPANSFGFLTFDSATDIAATPDGGFIITGRAQIAPGNGSDGLVFQVDANGEVVGATLHSFGHSVVDSLNSVTESGVVAGVAGITVSFPGPFITTSDTIAYLNINGTLYGRLNAGSLLPGGHYGLSQAIQRPSGGIAVIGNHGGGIFNGSFVGKLEGAGIAGITFPGEFGLSIAETRDLNNPSAPSYFGALSVTGVLDINATARVIVRKLDATTLLPVWERSIDGAAQSGNAFGRIVASPDGGFLVAAVSGVSSLFGTGSNLNILLTKLNADGQIVWSKVYGGRGEDGSVLRGETLDLIVTPDGYAFTVATDSFGTDDSITTSRDFWVVKTDLDGNIPVMTGLMQDVTSSMTVTHIASDFTLSNLVPVNFGLFQPLTQEEIEAEDFHPVINTELFNFGGTINGLTATNRVAIVPRVQSTVTFNSGAAQFQQDNSQTDESDSEFVDVIITRADATHGAYGNARVNYTITLNGSTSQEDFQAAPAELFGSIFGGPTPLSFHVDFADGELTKAIRIRALNDDRYEPNESITITLSDADPLNDIVLGTRTSTTVSFGDTTPFPGRAQFSAATYTVNEYKKTATITVNRVDGDGSIEVNYATVTGGTATAGSAEVPGSDYESVSGTLTFDPGVTSRTFTIPLFDDANTEGDETINLQLSNIVNGELGTPTTAVLTIHDVEAPAPITIETRSNGRIVFSRHSGDFVSDLFTVNANGTGLTNITNTEGASELESAWSRDGSRLAFSVFDFSANAAHGIYVSNADGTGRTRLTTSINDHSPTWSPDGTRIAYANFNGLFVMNADGSNSDSILSGSVTMPIWSPDGTHLIYQRTIDGVVGLYEIGVDGFGERQILTNFSGIFDYSYSPNGMQLIVNGSLDEVQAIFRANIDGSGTPERLIDVTFNDFTGMFSVGQPALSPDGNRLAFVNLSSRITVSNINGGSQTVLTSGATDSEPAWQPLAADLVAPSIVSLTPNPTLITDANTGDNAFTITVTFDEPMDTTMKPTLSFPNEDPSATITLNATQSDWADSTTYVAMYNVGTAAAFLESIDVQVSGANDLAGNLQSSTQVDDAFNIDLDGPADSTQPTVISFTRFNPSQATNTAPALVFRVTFSETIDFTTIDAADFTVTGTTAPVQFVNEVTETDGTVYEVAVFGGNLASLTSGTVGLNVSSLADIADLAGNLLVNAEPTLDEVYTRGTPTPNRVPSFTKGSNQTVSEDSGEKTVTNWATNISAGTGDVGQTVDFQVTNSNNALFSSQPAISSNGTLTFTPADNAFGTATVTVRIHDDGGTANGGVDTSAAQTFTVTVKSVNDTPTASSIAPVTINEDSSSGPISFTIGDAETAADKLTLKVLSSTNTKLIPTKNIVLGGSGANRTLSITPAKNLFGTATIAFTIKDGDRAVLTQNVQVTVNPVNDAPPTITNMLDVTVAEDTPTSAIKFTIDDADDKLVDLNAVTVTATSSNTDLVPNLPANIVLGGSKEKRTIQLVPLADQFGATTITVTATDTNGATATDTFVLTVTSVNDAPRVTAATFSIPEFTTNDTVVGTIEASDTEGDAITGFSISGGNTGNAFKIDNSGVIRVSDATKIDFEALAQYSLTIKATDALGASGSKSNETGPITVNVEDEDFAFSIDAVDTDNTVTVSKVGNNLVVRRGVEDLITPTSLDDVTSLTITGGTAKDTVILDASLNSAGTPSTKKFSGQIVVNGNDGDDKLDASKITVSTIGLTFDGGAGNDTALGGGGNDSLFGGDGNDSLDGGSGNDRLSGDDGDDALLGGKGDDTFLFSDTESSETDTLTEATRAGTDILDFSSLTTAVAVNLNSETALATHANRVIKTSGTGRTKLAPNFENVIGGAGDDSIVGNAAANSLLGGTGGDTILGGTGNDSINGGVGNDAIRGDDGNDLLNGDADNDTIIGGVGNDTVRGGDGNDTVIGGAGKDQVFGDAGSDLGLAGKGGSARGGSSKKDRSDVVDAVSTEVIDEAFATVFAFE